MEMMLEKNRMKDEKLREHKEKMEMEIWEK